MLSASPTLNTPMPGRWRFTSENPVSAPSDDPSSAPWMDRSTIPVATWSATPMSTTAG